jgi:hypothetical protein
MQADTISVPADELAAMRRELGAITARLNEALATIPRIPPDATAAQAARAAGRTRGWFTVKEFAAMLGKHPDTVSDLCACGQIKTLRGTGRHRIPLTEEERWNAVPR